MTPVPKNHLGYLDGRRRGAALRVVLAHCAIGFRDIDETIKPIS